MIKNNLSNRIISLAPGRTCLFGDHQDYLHLPVIACAIDRYIKLEAIENSSRLINIFQPDINRVTTINIDEENENFEIGDHLRSTLKVLKKKGCNPNKGYDVKLSGNIPINAGISSSSAVVVSWIRFLLEAFGCDQDITPDFVAQMAYESEVIEHGSPGGKMDQYSISLGNILFLETDDDGRYEIIEKPFSGLIIGESGIPKKTIGLLRELKENSWAAIHIIEKEYANFNIAKVAIEDLDNYLKFLPENLISYFVAAVTNHDITRKAHTEFMKDQFDLVKIGSLMNDHHKVLKNLLKITLPKIDNMIDAALEAGAYGAKIVGSGRGGSIVAIAPEGKERSIANAIINAGGKNAYNVSVDPGARIVF